MDTNKLAQLVVSALEDTKAIDIRVLDVAHLTSVTDKMIIATGQSTRQVHALADNVVTRVKENGVRPLSVEGEEDNEWVLVDLGNIIVHAMLPSVRELYDLEELWDRRPQ